MRLRGPQSETCQQQQTREADGEWQTFPDGDRIQRHRRQEVSKQGDRQGKAFFQQSQKCVPSRADSPYSDSRVSIPRHTVGQRQWYHARLAPVSPTASANKCDLRLSCKGWEACHGNNEPLRMRRVGLCRGRGVASPNHQDFPASVCSGWQTKRKGMKRKITGLIRKKGNLRVYMLNSNTTLTSFFPSHFTSAFASAVLYCN